MTIKKPIKNKPASDSSAEATVSGDAPAVGGATIADRFKLNVPDASANKAKFGKGDKCAVAAAFVGIAVAAFLVFTLWKHWEFLMPA